MIKIMRRRQRIDIVSWLFLVVMFLSNDVAMGNSVESRNMNNLNNQKYYFEMSKKDQEKFFKNLNSIKIGDSIQKVKKILGEPTYDQTIASKERGEFRARILKYYIRILEKNLVNEKYDRSVRLIFNAQNVLVEIESNLEEGSPKYYFEMSEKDQEKFFKNLNSIKIGDSVDKVKAFLGEPTYDQIGASKKGEFISRDFTYYIKILEKDLVNEKYDQYVELSFDAKDKLTKIESNITVEILIPVILEKERKLQKEADEGHQLWRLNPIDVSHATVLLCANKNVESKKCFLMTQNNDEAIVQCDSLIVNYRVYLKKYFGKRSIWTATKIQIIKN
jgi:hypothetical protein